jgi:hypothetical protein
VDLLKELERATVRNCNKKYFQLIISMSTFKKKTPSMSHLGIPMSFLLFSWECSFRCRPLMNNFGPGLLRLCPVVSMCIRLAWRQYAGLPGSSGIKLVLRKFCLSPNEILLYACALMKYWAWLYLEDKELINSGVDVMMKTVMRLLGKSNGEQQLRVLMYKSDREVKDEDGGLKSSQGET